MSYFSIAVLCWAPWPRQLAEGRGIWTCSSSWRRAHRGAAAFSSWTTSRKQTVHWEPQGFEQSKPAPSDVLPPARPFLSKYPKGAFNWRTSVHTSVPLDCLSNHPGGFSFSAFSWDQVWNGIWWISNDIYIYLKLYTYLGCTHLWSTITFFILLKSP